MKRFRIAAVLSALMLSISAVLVAPAVAADAPAQQFCPSGPVETIPLRDATGAIGGEVDHYWIPASSSHCFVVEATLDKPTSFISLCFYTGGSGQWCFTGTGPTLGPITMTRPEPCVLWSAMLRYADGSEYRESVACPT